VKFNWTSIARFLFRRPAVERELDDELRYHLDRQIELNMARGMPAEEARRAAVLTVGPVGALKDDCRDARTGRFLETLFQDVHYGLRVLRKNRGFTFAAVSTLALGIGANAAIFSLVYGVLLRPLPYRDGGQLVVLHQQNPKAEVPEIPFSVKELTDYRERSHTLQSVVEHHSMVFLLSDSHTAERVQTAVVSGNFFDVLGVRPLMGRTFVDADDQKGAAPVIVLSYKYWREHRGGDPKIVGKTFEMNSKPHTVIGVLPPIPQYPAESDLYMTTVQCPTRSSERFKANRKARMMIGFARLKPDVSLEQAQADLSLVADQMRQANPEVYPQPGEYKMAVAGLRDDLTHSARTTFFVLLGGAGFVLLIACANVANLMFARLLRMEREIAVRAALGASKSRLVRQMLTESILVSLGGGLAGLALAPLALSVLVKFATRYSTRAAEVHMDAPVLLFTLAIAVGTGVLFGLAPAFSSTKDSAEALKRGGGRNGTGGHQIVRAGLVVAQVAVSFTLLIGAGLMARSFLKLSEVDPGFRTDHLLSLRMTPNSARYRQSPDQLSALTENLMHRIKAINGVVSAAMVSSAPLSPSGIASGPGNVDFNIAGRPVSQGQLAPQVDITIADENYFGTIGQGVVSGRVFTAHDDARAPAVAVINQAMARHRWPGGNPIGERIAFAYNPDAWITVVGIVSDTREYGLGHPAKDEIYLPTAQQGGFSNNLIVRTAFEPGAAEPLIRAAIREVDPFIGLDQVETMQEFEYESMAPPRVTTVLLGIFAALALMMSVGGIAAMMSLAVTQQTRELGIRLALGARPGAIVSRVVRQGVVLAAAGIALGIAGAVALTRLLATLLYATSPVDTATFLAVSLVFLGVGAAASFVPARQVSLIDPLSALRNE